MDLPENLPPKPDYGVGAAVDLSGIRTPVEMLARLHPREEVVPLQAVTEARRQAESGLGTLRAVLADRVQPEAKRPTVAEFHAQHPELCVSREIHDESGFLTAELVGRPDSAHPGTPIDRCDAGYSPNPFGGFTADVPTAADVPLDWSGPHLTAAAGAGGWWRHQIATPYVPDQPFTPVVPTQFTPIATTEWLKSVRSGAALPPLRPEPPAEPASRPIGDGDPSHYHREVEGVLNVCLGREAFDPRWREIRFIDDPNGPAVQIAPFGSQPPLILSRATAKQLAEHILGLLAASPTDDLDDGALPTVVYGDEDNISGFWCQDWDPTWDEGQDFEDDQDGTRRG